MSTMAKLPEDFIIYLAEYINEEINRSSWYGTCDGYRGNPITEFTILDAIDAFDGGAADIPEEEN